MADPRAKSFPDMLTLATANHRQPSPFTLQLMLAIFWEESLFKNTPQLQGGPGIGFGQVERNQLFHLTSKNPRSQQFGYFVAGVSTTTTQVDDAKAVEISSCLLLHLFHHPTNTGSDKVEFALQGYAGVRAAAGTPLSAAQRIAIVQRWKDCALHLAMFPLMNGQIQLSSTTFVRDVENSLMGCLNRSRAFSPDAPDTLGAGSDRTVRQRLFPPLWQVPQVAKMLPTFMASAAQLVIGTSGAMVGVLQQLLNTKDTPDFMLSTDGQFGPKTLSGVQAFQKSRNLKVDGIVGPKTKSALVNT